MSSMEPLTLLDGAPSWLRISTLVGVLYLAYCCWSAVLRVNRERNLASRILDERRRAGIPDADKRPFKIAKAAAGSKNFQTATTAHAQKPKVTFSSDLPSHLHAQQNAPGSVQAVLTEPQDPPPTSKSRRRSSNAHDSRSTSGREHPSTTIPPTDSTRPTATSDPPNPKTNHSLPSKKKRTASAYASSEASPCGSPDLPTYIRTTKKVKTKSTVNSPNKRGLSNQTELNRKKTKLSVPGDLSFYDGPSDEGYDSQGEDMGNPTIDKGKKRILSDTISEADLQSHELKKNRTEKSVTRTDDDDDDVHDEEFEDETTDPHHLSQLDKEQDVDQDVFMIADDGKKKKLIQIKQSSDAEHLADQQTDEDAAERRWVTHAEFNRLKQSGKLLTPDEIWDDQSTTSSETTNILNDRPSNAPGSPRPRPDAEAEHGPIWSIEGKPSSRPSLGEASLATKIRAGTRPRNSLGRMRISLAPDPASPAPRSRTKNGPLIHDDRYIDDKPPAEEQATVTSSFTVDSPQPPAPLPSKIPVSAESSLPERPPAPKQAFPVHVQPDAAPVPPAQQWPGKPIGLGNAGLPTFALNDKSGGSFGSSTPSASQYAPPKPSAETTNNSIFKAPPASSSPFSFGSAPKAAQTEGHGSMLKSSSFPTSASQGPESAPAPIKPVSMFGTLLTTKPVEPATSKASGGTSSTSAFSFNVAAPSPARQKQSDIAQLGFIPFKPSSDNKVPTAINQSTNSVARLSEDSPKSTPSFSTFGATSSGAAFSPNTGTTKSTSIFGNQETKSTSIFGNQTASQSSGKNPNPFLQAQNRDTKASTNFDFGAGNNPNVSLPSSSGSISSPASAFMTNPQTSGTVLAPSTTLPSESPAVKPLAQNPNETSQDEQKASEPAPGLTVAASSQPATSAVEKGHISNRKYVNPRSARFTAGSNRVLAKAMSGVGKQAVAAKQVVEGSSGNKDSAAAPAGLKVSGSGPETAGIADSSRAFKSPPKGEGTVAAVSASVGAETTTGQAVSKPQSSTSPFQSQLVSGPASFSFAVGKPTSSSDTNKSKIPAFGQSLFGVSTLPATSTTSSGPFGPTSTTTSFTFASPKNAAVSSAPQVPASSNVTESNISFGGPSGTTTAPNLFSPTNALGNAKFPISGTATSASFNPLGSNASPSLVTTAPVTFSFGSGGAGSGTSAFGGFGAPAKSVFEPASGRNAFPSVFEQSATTPPASLFGQSTTSSTSMSGKPSSTASAFGFGSNHTAGSGPGPLSVHGQKKAPSSSLEVQPSPPQDDDQSKK